MVKIMMMMIIIIIIISVIVIVMIMIIISSSVDVASKAVKTLGKHRFFFLFYGLFAIIGETFAQIVECTHF